MFKKVFSLASVTLGVVMLTMTELLDNLELQRLQKIFYLFSILFLLVGFLVYIRNNVFRKKGKKKLENILPKSRVEHMINIVSNPKKELEEIGNLRNKIYKGERIMWSKLKSALKWLWGNKCTLFTTLCNVCIMAIANFMALTEYIYRFEVLAENKMVIQIAVPALSILWVIIDLYTTYSKRGCESLEELNAIAQAKAELKANKLTKEQKQTLKAQLTKLKGLLAPKEEQMAKARKRLEEIDTLITFGCASIEEQNEKIQLHKSIGSQNPAVETLKKQIASIEEKLSK